MSGFEDTGGKPLPRLQPDTRDAGAKPGAAPISGAPEKPAPRSAEKSAPRRKTAVPSHAGHRQRLRARFIEGGPDALPDYELLEMVLFRAIPRRDTKPLAKALIAHFGSFNEVITAPVDRLTEVTGVSEGVATELKLIQAAALRLAKSAVMDRPAISSWSALVDYCSAAMAYETTLLQNTDLVVTTTGNVNVCDANMLQSLKNGAVVCNIGHFDSEIDTAYMRENWEWEEVKPQVHKIYRDKASNNHLILLSEGRLVNLGNATGHPSRIMDGSFANQVLAQIYLWERKFADLPEAEKKAALYVKVLPKKLDEEVAAEMVRGFGGVITRMTDAQAQYINTPVDGPFKPDSYKY